MKNIVTREVLGSLRSALEDYPCALLLGPQQVGKTTLAKKLGKEWESGFEYMALDQNRDSSLLEDFDGFVEEHQGKLIILDEAQCLPDIFPKLKNLLDDNDEEKKSKWLLLGSAALNLISLASQHLGGRYKRIELTALQLTELTTPALTPMSTMEAGDEIPAIQTEAARPTVDKYKVMQKLWFRGGFPLSYLGDNDKRSFDWRCQYVDSAINSPELLQKLWKRLCLNQGEQCVSPGKLGSSQKEIDRLLQQLERGYLIRTLLPWASNEGKRYDKAQRIYIRDSGILHTNWNFANFDALLKHNINGKSWEGFVLEAL